MVGENLEKTRDGEAGWGKLKDIEMAVEQPAGEIGREMAGKLGGKILGALEVTSATETSDSSEVADVVEAAELQETLEENSRVKLMRENWGNFEKSRELFGPKTEMVPYEYGVIAENMPWEEFVKFCEQASELGGKSEREYENVVFDKASELCSKGLCLPRSLEIAVRRYNVAKQFGEKRPERFYYVTDLDQAAHGLAFMSGKMLEGQYGVEDRGDGKNPRRIHLQYDRVDENGAEQAGLNPEGMVTMVLDGSVIDDDEFDPVGGEPAMNRVEKAKILAVLGRDEMIADMFRVAQHQEGARGGADYDVMSVAQWQNGGEPVETAKETKRRRNKLLKESIMRPDKKEAREFVDPFLERVDDDELERLMAVYRQDPTQGMEEAVTYFAGVLGTKKEPKVVWDEKEKRGSGRRTAVGGELRFSAKDKGKAKPEVMLAAVGHEMFHEYQNQLEGEWAKDKLTPGSLEERQARLLYFNRDHYEVPDGLGLFYADQIEEVQAYHFGDTLKKRMKRLKRRR